MPSRLSQPFYTRDALTVAPELLGKTLVRRFEDGRELRFPVTEIEVYRGAEDLACHASKGRTSRTEIMYHAGGRIYMYLIYGMYWMLNFVVADENNPQALLIRGLGETFGPGRVSRLLELDGSFYGECLWDSKRLWMENLPAATRDQQGIPGAKDSHLQNHFITLPRVGIDYAGEPWISKPWRFRLSK